MLLECLLVVQQPPGPEEEGWPVTIGLLRAIVQELEVGDDGRIDLGERSGCDGLGLRLVVEARQVERHRTAATGDKLLHLTRWIGGYVFHLDAGLRGEALSQVALLELLVVTAIRGDAQSYRFGTGARGGGDASSG